MIELFAVMQNFTTEIVLIPLTAVLNEAYIC
jgi:hypothetical protein